MRQSFSISDDAETPVGSFLTGRLAYGQYLQRFNSELESKIAERTAELAARYREM